MHKWSLHEAKNKLSNLVEIASQGDPQIITKRGKEVVAIIKYLDYKNIFDNQLSLKKFLFDFGPKFESIEIKRISPNVRNVDL